MNFSLNHIRIPEPHFILITLDRNMMKKQCPHHFKGEMLPFLEVCGTQIVKNRLKPGFGQMDHISTNFLTRLIFIQFIYHSS